MTNILCSEQQLDGVKKRVHEYMCMHSDPLHLMEVKLMQIICTASTLSSKDEVTACVYKSMTQWVTNLEE